MVAKTISLPNIKKCFIPNSGYMIGDFDLKQADAQVVAWEANDDLLKTVFREKLDLHLANADLIFGLGLHLDDLRKPELVEKYKHDFSHQRDMAKRGVHLTNYLGKARACAKALGITVKEAEDFQRRWFQEHPGIIDWHQRIEDSIMTSRTVTNAFGYKMQYFDRIEKCISEAVAWIPQSTVALVIAKGMLNLSKSEYVTLIQLLMQVHDSIVHQFPRHKHDEALLVTKREMEIAIPYEDPLIIPVDAAVSSSSWGEVVDIDWPKVA